MSDADQTSRLRVADTVAGRDGVPVHRKHRERGREDSGLLARASLDRFDTFARAQFGSGLTEATKELLASEMESTFQRVLTHRQETRSESRTAAHALAPSGSFWRTLSAVLAAFLFLGALLATWDKIRTVEQRQTANDEYQMIVANWLVTESARQYNERKNTDQMLRAIARQVGVDVSDIPAPQASQPPTAINRRHNDYLISIGE